MERQQPEKITDTEILQSQAKFLRDIGLWRNSVLFEKYSYRLSPDALFITEEEKRQLDEIAALLYLSGGFFDGSLQIFNKTASLQFRSTRTGGTVARALTSGIKRSEIPLQNAFPSQKPFICRLDLVKTQRQEPAFQVVEIEGDKTHGFGFLSIMDYFREQYMGRRDTAGITFALKSEIKRQGFSEDVPLILLVGLSERFYITEMKIFEQFARAQGINLIAALETEVEIQNDYIVSKRKGIRTNILISLPTLTPNGYKASGIDEEALFDLYTSGKIKCLIPPKRFLGSKALLGIISNAGKDYELERLLNEVFDPNFLRTFRKYLPNTILVTKRNKNLVADLLRENPDGYVIKQIMTSGMKGVSLPNDPQKRKRFIEDALSTPFNYIIQEKVNQGTRAFSFAEPGTADIQQSEMFMRVELFATCDGIATIGVTARETPSVHGAKDAIQIPIIFER